MPRGLSSSKIVPLTSPTTVSTTSSSTSSPDSETEMTVASSSSSEQQPLVVSHLQQNHRDDDDNNNTHNRGSAFHPNTTTNTLNNVPPESLMSEEDLKKHVRAKTSLIIAIIFCVIFMIVELVSGIVAHSLAIMTDAAHMLTDVGSLALSLFAVIASQWQASDQFTFGFKRAEVVGALFSIMLVWGLVGVIIYEGVFRCVEIISCARGTQSQYTECEGTKPKLMLIVGCLGLVVNIGYAVILAWGGAEVKHAHSHGGDDDDHHHGHSHSHGAPAAPAAAAASASHHGHSHHGGSDGGGCGDSSTPVLSIRCCEPTKEELECDKETCDHEFAKNNKNQPQPTTSYASIDNGTCASVASLRTIHQNPEDHHHDHHDHHEDHYHTSIPTAAVSATNTKKQQEEEKQEVSAAKSFTDTLFGSSTNMNIRGAAVHALGDCLQSVGVIIAAGVIWGGCGVEGDPTSYFNIADPACSLMFAFITLWTTKSLFVEVFGILMERAPRGVHVSCIKRKFEHYPGILEVKDIFIWSISNDRTALGAHCIVRRDATTDEIFGTLDKARTLCTQLGFCMSAIEVLREGDESADLYKTLTPASAAPSPTNHGHSHSGGGGGHGHSH